MEEELITQEETDEILACVRRWLGEEPENEAMRLLARGVRASSERQWLDAQTGVAEVNDGYQELDYQGLNLPSASYWSRERGAHELDQPIKHALGGDFPSNFDDARRGVMLFRWFEVRQIGEPASENSVAAAARAACRGQNITLRLPPGLTNTPIACEIFPPPSMSFAVDRRGERLVFARADGCLCRSLQQIVEIIAPGRPEVRLGEMYEGYLRNLRVAPGCFEGDPDALIRAYSSDSESEV